MDPLDTFAQKLNLMGFVCQKREGGLLCRAPLSDYSFKLYYSPSQALIFFQANRYSTERLLLRLQPELEEIAKTLGLRFVTRKGF